MTSSKGNEGEIIVDYDELTFRKEVEQTTKNLPRYTKDYLVGLLPIFKWIHRYNVHWLVGDLIAGITVGIVIVPQSMAYAKIAQLPPQYGLYTGFVGLCIYCLFATSKDISIGPTAVMSLLVGQTVTRITASNPDITPEQIAVAFSLFTGAIATFIGLVRLGILVDFIPAPAIAGFMTGSAITISIGQWPALFGLKSFINTQDSAYLIFGHFFQNLPKTKLDVAFGLVGLVWLYGVRYLCQYLTKRFPKYSMPLFFFSIMRNGVLVIVGTAIAYAINIGKTTSPISILKTVPSGFQAMAVPSTNVSIISDIASSLPSGVIILILEHVAIAKSFGRVNNYTINPDQEIIAIGFTNIWGAFFGAYPSTGSFSRTAIKARSGVRTPIAGVFSAAVVVLALYVLTPAFYYIPDAILAAVVIHAVVDLVSGPSYIKRLAAVSLWELFVFFAAVIITFFTTVEYGIYASVGLSILILLFRIARPRFWALGRVPLISDVPKTEPAHQRYLYVSPNHPSLGKLVEPLPRGILMCRVEESFTYPNSSYVVDRIVEYCKDQTRRGGPVPKKSERAWNDASTAASDADRQKLPILHALILDFASVNRLDSSGLQAVVDAQTALNRHAGQHVEFHFVNIVHPAIRQSLIVAGFGTQPLPGQEQHGQEILPVVPVSMDGPQQPTASQSRASSSNDIESNLDDEKFQLDHIDHDFANKTRNGSASTLSLPIPVPKDVYPFFHWSGDEAVNAATHSLSLRETIELHSIEVEQDEKH
ncbi:sulfate permease [Hesseltinella vesiculosa]|uniref:Sulfate permease n=1 Tax=Hesseltinella vesiculosa TaxID=101127 RepID=A0A1X2GG29_9FUNG|nr:sulfate permease [Hesseltinella vesiculosa]